MTPEEARAGKLSREQILNRTAQALDAAAIERYGQEDARVVKVDLWTAANTVLSYLKLDGAEFGEAPDAPGHGERLSAKVMASSDARGRAYHRAINLMSDLSMASGRAERRMDSEDETERSLIQSSVLEITNTAALLAEALTTWSVLGKASTATATNRKD